MRHLCTLPLPKCGSVKNRCGWPFRLLCAAAMHISPVCEHKERIREYTLPWPHCSKPFAQRAPLLHRLTGKFLLKHLGWKQLGSDFSTTDFLLGVSDAVKAYADVLNEHRYQDLKSMFSPSLYRVVDTSLRNLPAQAEVNMDVSTIKGQTLCSVNAIFGDAQPGDEHAIEWLGQKVLTSKSQMMKTFEDNSHFTFRNARALGVEATLNRLEFVIGVSFFTRSYFKVVDITGQTLQGDDQYVEDFHYWKFSSLVYDRKYPFEWIVVDINNFMYSSCSS